MPVLNYDLAIPKVEKRCVSALREQQVFMSLFFSYDKKIKCYWIVYNKVTKNDWFQFDMLHFHELFFFILGLWSGLSPWVQKRCGSVLYPWHNSNSKQQKWQFFGWFRKRFGKTHGTGCYWVLPRRNQRTWSQRSRHLQNFRRRIWVQRTVGKNCLRQWTYA